MIVRVVDKRLGRRCDSALAPNNPQFRVGAGDRCTRDAQYHVGDQCLCKTHACYVILSRAIEKGEI